jgi:myo-inositol 2-dehydrogenase / D-chiro-inositol 1-dehydrogenase
VEFWGGKIAYFYSSRMMAAGQHDMTEIIGTNGKLSVNANPIGKLVEISESSGVRREIPQDYWGRFEYAFVTEANEFVEACLENKKLPFKLSGAVQAVKIGCALQESLNSGKMISFDETGRRIEKANL